MTNHVQSKHCVGTQNTYFKDDGMDEHEWMIAWMNGWVDKMNG